MTDFQGGSALPEGCLSLDSAVVKTSASTHLRGE